jgi:hypothetical protein
MTKMARRINLNTTQVNYNRPGFYALFKGPSGSGKTVGALSFPGIYHFDFDRKMPWIARKHFSNKSIDYDTYTQIGDVYDKLMCWLKGQIECPYETLVFDSLTYLATLIIQNTGEAKGEDITMILKSMVPTRKGTRLIESLSYDYYNNEVRFIDWIMVATRKLWADAHANGKFPRNVIFTAHTLENRSKPNIETKLVTVTRSIFSIGTKAAAIVPANFDEVYLFATMPDDSPMARVRHLMTTETCGDDDAKTAFVLPQIIDFTNGNLYDELLAAVAGSNMFI